MTTNDLIRLLMDGRLPPCVSLQAEVLSIQNFPSFTLQQVRYRSHADRINTLLVSLPNVSTPAPVLLALHGHEAKWGQADEGAYHLGHVDDFCAYFAQRGWVVVQPATMDHRLQYPSWTLQGQWTWDAMVALDYTLALSQANPRKVAVCGLSTGGHLAMNVLALDSRVQTGVVGCVLSSWNHYRKRFRIPPHCDCGILGQLGDHFEQHQWAAVIAPKPVQYQYGRQDACFSPNADPNLLDPAWNTGVMPQKEFDEMWEHVQQAYQQKGGVVALHFHERGHVIDNIAAWAFLNEHLK